MALAQSKLLIAIDDVEHSPIAPSAFGDPLIVFRDPDRIQLQIYGIKAVSAPEGCTLTGPSAER